MSNVTATVEINPRLGRGIRFYEPIVMRRRRPGPEYRFRGHVQTSVPLGYDNMIHAIWFGLAETAEAIAAIVELLGQDLFDRVMAPGAGGVYVTPDEVAHIRTLLETDIIADSVVSLAVGADEGGD